MPPASFMPAMFGDFVGFSSSRLIFTQTEHVVRISTPTSGGASGFKIAENESPRPVDRIYYLFNYYDDVDRARYPNVPFAVTRHVLGGEKTLLGGDASIGMRVPFTTINGAPPTSNPTSISQTDINAFQQGGIADLSLVLKYAFINNRETQNVFSGGLVITVPTGDGFVIDTGFDDFLNPIQTTLHPALIQPWLGYIYNFARRSYLHGFSSIIVPFDSRVPTVLCNDIGLGLWLYRNARDRFVQGIVPTVEFHVNTPLTNCGSQFQPIGMANEFNITSGIYAILPHSTFGFAMGVPVVGPRPYDFEVIASYTLRF